MLLTHDAKVRICRLHAPISPQEQLHCVRTTLQISGKTQACNVAFLGSFKRELYAAISVVADIRDVGEVDAHDFGKMLALLLKCAFNRRYISNVSKIWCLACRTLSLSQYTPAPRS